MGRCGAFRRDGGTSVNPGLSVDKGRSIIVSEATRYLSIHSDRSGWRRGRHHSPVPATSFPKFFWD